jgi:isoleucyl-tRNA synthetase
MLAKSTIPLDNYYIDIIASELNIKNVEFNDDLSEYTSYVFKPQLKTVGPKYGKLLNSIKEYLTNIDGSSAYAALKKDGFISFDVNGTSVELKEEDLIIEASKKPGFITAIDGQTTVVMDVSLDDQLIEEGYVREVVSKIQTMRKESNFEVLDRIEVCIFNNSKIEDIISRHKDLLLKDIMAKDVVIGIELEGSISKEWDINDEKVKIGIKK